MSRVKNVFRGRGGFTLIELLIVIVIIGILAAIAIPNLADLLGTADRGAVESEMRQVMTDITAFRATDGDYPDAADRDSNDDGDGDVDWLEEDFSQAAESLLEQHGEDEITIEYIDDPTNDDEFGSFVGYAILEGATWNSLGEDEWMVVISEERGFEAFGEGEQAVADPTASDS